ncbi:hypothetical protein PhaeoP128_03305 [Phaeobacter gallaeciensis]|nr:hypothetical protein PhaeoP129_03304 [Phaeobacter gallaeciensis]ATF24011.1 hypothetical protein PhaeoP128_03305 [Phaeobacter gallaeciensis]
MRRPPSNRAIHRRVMPQIPIRPERSGITVLCDRAVGFPVRPSRFQPRNREFTCEQRLASEKTTTVNEQEQAPQGPQCDLTRAGTGERDPWRKARDRQVGTPNPSPKRSPPDLLPPCDPGASPISGMAQHRLSQRIAEQCSSPTRPRRIHGGAVPRPAQELPPSFRSQRSADQARCRRPCSHIHFRSGHWLRRSTPPNPLQHHSAEREYSTPHHPR